MGNSKRRARDRQQTITKCCCFMETGLSTETWASWHLGFGDPVEEPQRAFDVQVMEPADFVGSAGDETEDKAGRGSYGLCPLAVDTTINIVSMRSDVVEVFLQKQKFVISACCKHCACFETAEPPKQ